MLEPEIGHLFLNNELDFCYEHLVIQHENLTCVQHHFNCFIVWIIINIFNLTEVSLSQFINWQLYASGIHPTSLKTG